MKKKFSKERFYKRLEAKKEDCIIACFVCARMCGVDDQSEQNPSYAAAFA